MNGAVFGSKTDLIVRDDLWCPIFAKAGVRELPKGLEAGGLGGVMPKELKQFCDLSNLFFLPFINMD